jgi:ubiquinone biosynthesis monooxygenase Coq6
VVWARSVRLEVINELDTIKAALMITAGVSGGGSRVGSRGWGLGVATRGLETFSGVADGVKVVGSGLVTVAGVVLQQFWNILFQVGRR